MSKPPTKRLSKPTTPRGSTTRHRQLSPAAGHKTPDNAMKTGTRSTLIGAMFLMATSAIGPGFITQTTLFTVSLGAAFAFAIAASILVDIALQLNVWRVIGVSGRRAQELGNLLAPRLGYGDGRAAVRRRAGVQHRQHAGTGLGTDAMLGLDPKLGGALSALIAIGVFLSKRAGLAMDRVVLVLGALMILLTTYIAITSGPPVGQAMKNVVLPEQVDFLVITTLIGGTIGGYIVYAGAHRLLDSGLSGPQHVREISRGSDDRHPDHRRDADRPVPRHPRCRRRRRDARPGEPDGLGVPAGCRRVRAAGLRRGPLGGRHHLGDRSVVHDGLLRHLADEDVGLDQDRAGGAVHRGQHRHLPVDRYGAGQLLVFAGAFNGLLLPLGIGVILWVAGGVATCSVGTGTRAGCSASAPRPGC